MSGIRVQNLRGCALSWSGDIGPYTLQCVGPETGDVVLARYGEEVLRLSWREARLLRTALAVLEEELSEPLLPAETSRAFVSPSRYGKPWTQEEDDELFERFAAGEPRQAIAVALQRTRAGVGARLSTLHGREAERRLQALEDEEDPPSPELWPERRAEPPAQPSR